MPHLWGCQRTCVLVPLPGKVSLLLLSAVARSAHAVDVGSLHSEGVDGSAAALEDSAAPRHTTLSADPSIAALQQEVTPALALLAFKSSETVTCLGHRCLPCPSADPHVTIGRSGLGEHIRSV